MAQRPTNRMKIAFRILCIVAVTMWAIGFAPLLAFAQPTDSYSDQRQVEVPSPAAIDFSQQTKPTQTFLPIVRGPCDPDYWIISSRYAREHVEAGQAYDYEVFRFDGPQPGRNSSMDELLASLQPGVPVCFMAHGSFVTWESMLNDSARTYPWLRQAAPCQPVHLIFYTWASDDGGCIPHLRVNKLGRRAALNGFYLADLVSKISIDHPVCLIGHSHGTRLVTAALHSMAGGEVEGRVLASGIQPTRRIRVVLAAAAIDHNWLNPNERYGRALCPAEAMINLRNSVDFPLLFHPLRRPFAGRALAISGLTDRDRESLGDWNEKFIDYSVTDLVGLGHIWAHYYNQPRIADAIRHYVYFDE